MKIAIAKRNPVRGTTTFYVASESKPKVHYTVQCIARGRKTMYFCTCADFIYRHLPHIGTNTFSGCKHTKAVKAASASAPGHFGERLWKAGSIL